MNVNRVFLITTIVFATSAAGMEIFSHTSPTIAPRQLLNLTRVSKFTSLFTVLISLATGLVISGIPKIRKRVMERKIVIRNNSPYVWCIKAILVVAFVDYILAPSAAIRMEGSIWLLGSGRGRPWLNIPESEAVMHLLGNLRQYAAIVLIFSLLWAFAAYAMLANSRTSN